MKHYLIFGSLLFTTIIFSCGNNSNESKASESDTLTVSRDNNTMATAAGTQVAASNLMSTSDSTASIGTAKFYKLDDGQIRLDLEINDKARADSNVAVHFHEHGDCGNKGDNTHGHWNPTKENHGEWGSAAYHSGDIGNIKLDATGHGTKSVTTNRWSIDSGSTNIIGIGIIVHGGTDDYKTQPTGNSGPRIGCGVINKM